MCNSMLGAKLTTFIQWSIFFIKKTTLKYPSYVILLFRSQHIDFASKLLRGTVVGIAYVYRSNGKTCSEYRPVWRSTPPPEYSTTTILDEHTPYSKL
jgi:hypothetical protein